MESQSVDDNETLLRVIAFTSTSISLTQNRHKRYINPKKASLESHIMTQTCFQKENNKNPDVTFLINDKKKSCSFLMKSWTQAFRRSCYSYKHSSLLLCYITTVGTAIIDLMAARKKACCFSSPPRGTQHKHTRFKADGFSLDALNKY